MAKQKAFFLSKLEILQKEHPEQFEKQTKRARISRSSSKSSSRSSSGSSKAKVFDCTTCGLDQVCKSGRIKRQGREGSILIVGTSPSKTDDDRQTLFTGSSGSYLNSILKQFGINFYKDCIHTNIVQCAPCKKDTRGRLTYTTATKDQIKCCSQKLIEDIQEVKPELILCLGGEAMKAVLDVQHVTLPPLKKVHGKVFPSQKHNCWVGCSFHPSYILMGKKENEAIFINDLLNIFSKLGEPLPKPLTMAGNNLILDANDAINLLEAYCVSDKPVAFDYETTCISAHDDNARLLTVALSDNPNEGYCIYLDNSEWNLVEQAAVYHSLKRFLQSPVPKVVQNFNMEEVWGINHVGASMSRFIWDTMVSTHVINCRSNTTSLGFQVYELTGHDYKEMVDVKNLENEPIELVSDYNCLDARYTLMLYYHQKKILEDLEDEELIQFNDFYTRCLKPLAFFKDRGIRIDVEQLNYFYEESTKESEQLLEVIAKNPGVLKFEEQEDKKFNMNSGKQLGTILYDIYGIESVKKTATGESTDEDTLAQILEQTKISDVKSLLSSILNFRKISGFLKRVVQYQELTDSKGFIHPTYNLNIAESYRSTATNPNSQNIYKRDKNLLKFRKIIIPSPGNVLLECDYDALEVKVIAMASQDKNLTKQILDGVDPHAKWSSEIFQLDPKDFVDNERYLGKNKFVFPSFYGSTDNNIAKSFPDIPKQHIINVQKQFWKEYSAVKDWQNYTMDVYKTQGFVRGLSGFKRPGPLNINQLYNTPIQGTAFHLLLDGLQSILLEINRRGLKAVPFMEVHDSISFDTPMDEVEELVDLANKILCAKRFDWQRNIPTTISWEIGENWLEMEKL